MRGGLGQCDPIWRWPPRPIIKAPQSEASPRTESLGLDERELVAVLASKLLAHAQHTALEVDPAQPEHLACRMPRVMASSQRADMLFPCAAASRASSSTTAGDSRSIERAVPRKVAARSRFPSSSACAACSVQPGMLLRLMFSMLWRYASMAAARSPYVDQSQSLNLFIAGPSIGKLSSMYLHAWKSGLKTTYYLRSRPATRIQQATVSLAPTPVVELAREGGLETIPTPPTKLSTTDEQALACSLENPESCEACQ